MTKLSLKPGVATCGVGAEVFLIVHVALQVWDLRGEPSLTVTSLTDGVHRTDSLHYKGLAVDIRVRDLHNSPNVLCADLASALGQDYDVIFEIDHIHVEYDPDRPRQEVKS